MTATTATDITTTTTDDRSDEEDEDEEYKEPIKIANLDDLTAIKRAYEEMFCDLLLRQRRNSTDTTDTKNTKNNNDDNNNNKYSITESHKMTNIKIVIGTIACAFAFTCQFFPLWVRKQRQRRENASDVVIIKPRAAKFSEDPFMKKLTIVCVLGYIITNIVLTLFILMFERGVILWGTITNGGDDDDDESNKVSICARIHHVRYSEKLTLELCSKEMLNEKIEKTNSTNNNNKTKNSKNNKKNNKGEIVFKAKRGRVSKIISVGDFIYEDGYFAEQAFAREIEKLVMAYKASFSNGKKFK
jgi:hypothetical protein